MASLLLQILEIATSSSLESLPARNLKTTFESRSTHSSLEGIPYQGSK